MGWKVASKKLSSNDYAKVNSRKSHFMVSGIQRAIAAIDNNELLSQNIKVLLQTN